jgi:CRP-like cAMP-binding protein
MEALFSVLDQISPLTTESKRAFAAITKTRQLPKGFTLLHAGAVSNHMFFIQQGLTRTFYLKDGKDVTDWISFENTFAVSVISFITRTPDRRGIELLEDSTIVEIPYYELEQLYPKHRDIETLGRLWSNFGIVQLQNRFDDLHFATATERYKKFIDRNPFALQRVPLGIVASFLGITQETLSRIRAQM